MKNGALVFIAVAFALIGAVLLLVGVWEIAGRGWALIVAALECFVVYAVIARGIDESSDDHSP